MKFNEGKSLKRILILRGSSQYVSPKTYNVQEIGLAKALVKLGWNVVIVSSGPQECNLKIDENIEWIELKRIGKTFGFPKGVDKIIKDFKPDIIQCQDITNLATYQALLSKIKLRVPLVISLGEYKTNGFLKSIFTHITARSIKNHTSAVLCKTKSAMEFSKRLGLNSTFYAPVGIDRNVYVEKEDFDDWWISELQTRKRNGEQILCHIGRLDKLDNVEFIISVLKKLPKNFSLLLIGEPKEFVNKFIDNEIKKRLIITGAVPNKFIGIALSNSDLYLACSKYEIFGMSAAESIFHGCPVFGYSTGGIKEIVRPDHNGWLLSERDSNEWANKIKSIFSHEEMDNMKRNCMESGESLTWDFRAIIYNQIYIKFIN
ncbi:glycosyltransferase [Bacillus salipaludis]|uniref:Glycosyltransferase n=1 Tax=Bacillus salipaludis TaxID=2547811 RepID=A0AA90QR78_9BACI|nr:glycosyltransferase [Bacillus salipaludis]MDQ6595009.1 glycosyltransferase [Bacillus salipaludis]